MNIPRPHLCLVLLAVIAVSGCGTARKSIYTNEELLDKIQPRLTEQDRERFLLPFAISPEVRDTARRAVKGLADDYSKVVELVDLIMDRARLHVIYDRGASLSADEVFQGGVANCLSFTNLFIAMAREVGLEAVFVDVIEVEEIDATGEIIVHSGHICGGVFQNNTFMLIDFAPDPMRRYVRYTIIDDIEAIAHFYNNLGYQAGVAGDNGMDIEYYRMATRIKPDFSKAYNNLGVALTQRGQFDDAEAAYHQAISLSPNFGEAYGNLANLYFYRQNYRMAMEHYRKAVKYSTTDYYFHSRLGSVYLAMEKYDGAIQEFRKALRRKPGYPPALNGLGLAFFHKGDYSRAVDYLKKAVARDPAYKEAAKNLAYILNHMKYKDAPMTSPGDHEP